jgi:elongation factor G
MKEFTSSQLRNVCFASHSGSGKTTLAESCLHAAGVIERTGSVDNGQTVSDFLPDEIKRKSSIYSSLLTFEYSGTKFNVLDSPGFADFFGETCGALWACENVVLVANAAHGVEIGLETVARRCHSDGHSCFVFINQLDRDRADFDVIYDDLHDRLHLPVVALNYPLGRESDLRGVVDVIDGIAYEDRDGKLMEVALPDACRDRISALRSTLIETLVECDDADLEKYLNGEDIDNDELRRLIHEGLKQGRAIPVLCGSATANIGVSQLLDVLKNAALSPAEFAPRSALRANDEVLISCEENVPFSGYVFKTFSDPFTGRLTFIKIASGVLGKDADVVNAHKGHHEKLAHLQTTLGKKHEEIARAVAGDIVMVAKLKNTTTGDTLASQSDGTQFQLPELPESLYALAIEPATRGDDDKLMDALHKIEAEDCTLRVERRSDTGQLIIAGLGDVHLQTVIARLKSSFGVEVVAREPQVAYRETIRQAVKQQGKLKKQSGGHGQFADVWLQIEPLASSVSGEGSFEFVDKIVGGVVPRQFIPAVEEGVREALREGPLAGYPLVDVRVTLYDGKYHDVDSSFQTFKMAGALGLREGARAANPTLLEPIMETKIKVPEEYSGEVMGDLNGRRGQILGMESDSDHGMQITARIPDAELAKYSIVLRSLTQGRGCFSKAFAYYAPMPENAARRVVEERQQAKAL